MPAEYLGDGLRRCRGVCTICFSLILLLELFRWHLEYGSCLEAQIALGGWAVQFESVTCK